MSNEEKKMQSFFAMLAQHGVTEAICINPPEGGGVVTKIEPTGQLTMVDKRDGKRKKIKVA